MKAHLMKGDEIVNTILVESLSVLPNLVDASIGGSIGDKIIDGVVVPRETAEDPIASIKKSIQQIEQEAAPCLRGDREIIIAMAGSIIDLNYRCARLEDVLNQVVYDSVIDLKNAYSLNKIKEAEALIAKLRVELKKVSG